MPPCAKLQLDKLEYDFLWNGKPELVSQEVIVPKRERGGLALVTIEKKIHALDWFGVPPHVTPSFLVLLIFDLKPYRHSIKF